MASRSARAQRAAGEVVEIGTHDELVERGGLYAQLYQEQYGGGLVEARCANGVVLSSGQVVDVAEPPAA